MEQKDFYDWENMSVFKITSLMVMWFNFERVDIRTLSRPSVASRIWYELEIHERHHQPHASMYISAQRLDIVKRKLIEYLDSKNIRDDYKKSLNPEI